MQFGGGEADKPRVDTFAAADRSYDIDQKSASSRDGSVANGVGLNSVNNLRSVECFMKPSRTCSLSCVYLALISLVLLLLSKF